MSAAGGRDAAPSRLRALWAARPPIYSRSVWTLMLILDALPWPLGEDVLARMFAAVALVKPSRRRPALRWAAHHAIDDRSARRLAQAACAFRGRWVARSALLGVRRPDDLRGRVVVRGARLAATPAGTILLGFHLGPPNADVALRVAGHRLAWLGTRRTSRAWSRPPWRAFLDPAQNLAPPAAQWFWPGLLYRARGILLDGGAIFAMADAWAGRELFRIHVPGGAMTIRAGWLALHQQTAAAVLPVLTHLEGRSQVITIHPPLPKVDTRDPAALRAWEDILGALVRDHVARFPEQCPALLFPPQLHRRRPPAAPPPAPPGSDATAGAR